MESVILRNRRPKPGNQYADPMLANRTSQLIVADQICASRPPRRAFQYAPKKAPSKTDGAKHTIARGAAFRAPKSPDHDHQHSLGAELTSAITPSELALHHQPRRNEPTNSCSVQARSEVLRTCLRAVPLNSTQAARLAVEASYAMAGGRRGASPGVRPSRAEASTSPTLSCHGKRCRMVLRLTVASSGSAA